MPADLIADGDEPVHGPGRPVLYSLVYCSRARDGVDSAEVDRIVATSRRGNRARGITGLLVFGDGLFFQWLEGPRYAVLELMALIEADPRHHTVVVLDTEEMHERMFADWDMERVSGEDVRQVLEDALETTTHPGSAQILRDMLVELDSGRLSTIGRA